MDRRFQEGRRQGDLPVGERGGRAAAALGGGPGGGRCQRRFFAATFTESEDRSAEVIHAPESCRNAREGRRGHFRGQQGGARPVSYWQAGAAAGGGASVCCRGKHGRAAPPF